MKTLHRPSESRLHRRDDWKTSAYGFVPYQTHFGELCGFADDVVAPGRGFGMHPHRDMEISTIMLSGAQRHEDSTGSVGVLETGAVQTMSAGTGISHSEVNASTTESFHSLQIWVYPRRPGGAPRHETFSYGANDERNRVRLTLSPDRREGTALIGQDAFFARILCDGGRRVPYDLHMSGNGVYVHCVRGQVLVGDRRLGPGDALGVWETHVCELEGIAPSELVLVEVPMARGVRV